MFLEKEIEQLGKRLLEKAGLQACTTFTIYAPDWIVDGNCFDPRKRIIYSVPERNFYEFKSNQRYFWQKFGAGAEIFLDVQKISISHEIGHALQTNLEEVTYELHQLKSFESLTDVYSIEELLVCVERFRKRLIVIEKDAWERGWQLIHNEVNKELFDLIRLQALRSYEEADLLQGENEFAEVYEFLTSKENTDLIGFGTKDEKETIRVKMMHEGTLYQGELLREDDEYSWLKETIRTYNPVIKKWETVPTTFDVNALQFAIDDIKQNLKKV